MSNMNQMTSKLCYNNISHSNFMEKVATEFPLIQPISGQLESSGNSGYMKVAFEASNLEIHRASQLRELIDHMDTEPNIDLLNKYHIQLYETEITQATILLIINNRVLYN